MNCPLPPEPIAAAVLMIRLSTPALSNSIFTAVPTAPEYIQRMVCVVPTCKLWPPFGLVTLIPVRLMRKSALLLSVTEGLAVLLRRMRYVLARAIVAGIVQENEPEPFAPNGAPAEMVCASTPALSSSIFTLPGEPV